MPAGLLLRRAAGMENGRALVRRDAREFQFLERRGRHGGNLCPVPDRFRRQTPCGADYSIGAIVFDLECKKVEGELIENRVVSTHGGKRFVAALIDWGIDKAMSSKRNGFAQTRAEV